MSPTLRPRPDPAWIRSADKGYAALLWLFPGSHREQFGDLMRQAFRDRCREVARGERTAWQCFALELAPDLLTTLGRESVETTFGQFRPRTALLLGLLIVSSAYYLFAEAMGLNLADGVVAVRREVKMQLVYAPQIRAINRSLHKVADPLAAEESPRSKALAAFLYRSKQPLRRKEQPDGQSQVLAGLVLAGDPGDMDLVLLSRNCWRWTSCDLPTLLPHLIKHIPENGYTWTLEYVAADRERDVPQMRRALANLARASKYDAYEGAIAAAVLDSAERFAPGDNQTRDVVARTIVYSGHSSSFELFCSPVRDWRHSAVNAEQLESARDDCVRAGRLMARSTEFMTARQGWRLVAGRTLDPVELATAQSSLRELEQLKERFHTDPRGEQDWLDRSKEMWIASYPQGLGEIPSVRWWLASQSRPDTGLERATKPTGN